MVFFVGAMGVGFYIHTEVPRGPASIEIKDDGLLDPSKNAHTSVYHFTREIQAKMEGQKNLLDVSLHGRFWVTVLKESEEGSVLSLQFEMKSSQQQDILTSTIPFVLEMTADHAIRHMRAPEPADKDEEDQVNLLKDFATLYAFHSNQDTAGVYDFDWKESSSTFQKKKIHYQGSRLSGVKILNSLHEITLDSKTRELVKVEGSDDIAMSAEAGSSLISHSSYTITKLDDAYHPVLNVSAKNLPTLKDQAGEIQSKFHKTQVQEYALLKQELDQLNGMNKEQRLSFFHEFVKTLRADPSKVDDFRKKMEAMAKQPGALAFGVGVLATVGSEHAQEVLTQWYQDYAISGKDNDIGHTILNAFTTADAQASGDTRKFLMGVAASRDPASADLAENAAFALGSTLKKADDEAARAQLNSMYASATTSQGKTAALDAIGNSGDPRFLSTIQSALSGGDSSTKQKAVFALRYMDPAAAAPTLLQAYQDSDPAVRQAAIRAVYYQNDMKPYSPVIQGCTAKNEAGCSALLSRAK